MYALGFSQPTYFHSSSLHRRRLPSTIGRQGRNMKTTHPMASARKNLGVVITGASRGVGFALAVEFLRAGDKVVICSRGEDQSDIQSAVAALDRFNPGSIYHVSCDVSKPADVKRLANFAADELEGGVDCWINNAGQVGTRGNLVDLSAEDVVGVVNTNLLGSLLCCREAHRIMKDSGGHVFTMDGAGSGGNATATYVAYGATKRAVPQMVSSLSKELRDSTVRFHTLSPGMVLTDLLLSGNEDDTTSLQFFNYLAEEPETVAQNLVPRIRSVVLTNSRRSQYVKFLTLPRAFLQIAAGFLFGFRKNRYFDANGERVDKASGNFNEHGVRRLY